MDTSNMTDEVDPHVVLDKALGLLKTSRFTRKDWILLGEALDGGYGDYLLEKVNEHLMKIAPEVFGETDD